MRVSCAADRHTAPTADAADPDARRVCIVLYGQKIHRSAEIFDVDVRGSTIPGLSAALAGKRRVKGKCQKAVLRHSLCIQAGGPFLYCAERAADRNGRQLSRRIFRRIQICRQRNAVAIVESHLSVSIFPLWGNTLSHSCVIFSFSSIMFISLLSNVSCCAVNRLPITRRDGSMILYAQDSRCSINTATAVLCRAKSVFIGQEANGRRLSCANQQWRHPVLITAKLCLLSKQMSGERGRHLHFDSAKASSAAAPKAKTASSTSNAAL